MQNRLANLLFYPPVRAGLALVFLLSTFSAIALDVTEVQARPITIDPESRKSVLYFEETGHFVQDTFLDYWRAQGGYMEFGPPLSEEYVDQDLGKRVQYFSKARFELVPLPRERGWRVELGAINREISQSPDILISDDYARALKPKASGVNNLSNRFFKQTGHSISGPFLDRWVEANGIGNRRDVTQEDEEIYFPITRYGLPLSEPYDLTILGISYKAQDFERTRMLLQTDGSVTLANISQFVPGLSQAPTEKIQNTIKAPVYSRTTLPRWVEVNLTTQTASFFEGDQVVRHSLITSGEWKHETPTGTFPIFSRIPNERMKNGKPGDPDYYDLKNVLYTQYFTPAGHALHYAWWRSEFGYRGSHGCINEDINTSRFAWDFLNIGDKVVIRY